MTHSRILYEYAELLRDSGRDADYEAVVAENVSLNERIAVDLPFNRSAMYAATQVFAKYSYLLRRRNQLAPALDWADRAVRIVEKLGWPKTRPSPDHINVSRYSYDQRALARELMGQFAEAAADFASALALTDESEVEMRSHIHLSICRVTPRAGDPAATRNAYLACIGDARGRVASRPDDNSSKRYLAHVTTSYGGWLLTQSAIDECNRWFAESRSIRAKLGEDNPNDTADQNDLIYVEYDIGQAYNRARLAEAALDYLTRAEKLVADRLAVDANDAEPKRMLPLVRENRGAALLQIGQFDAAAGAFHSATQVCTDVEVVERLQFFRAEALGRAGHADLAAEILAPLLDMEEPRSANLLPAARAYTRLWVALPPNQPKREAFGARAVMLLRLAFREQITTASNVRDNPEFQPLHDRADGLFGPDQRRRVGAPQPPQQAARPARLRVATAALRVVRGGRRPGGSRSRPQVRRPGTVAHPGRRRHRQHGDDRRQDDRRGPLPAAARDRAPGLRVRDRDRIELFESMDAAIVYVRDGCVRLRLVSSCRRLVVFVTLDFTRESLISEPLTDIQYHDDGTPDAAKMMLQWTQVHRWWFGSNGVIELWDKATATRLARAQHYMPPVNSLFPHDAFEKMERELRARAVTTESRDGTG
jgi:tetratricopeptide (TPR) repeat protein